MSKMSYSVRSLKKLTINIKLLLLEYKNLHFTKKLRYNSPVVQHEDTKISIAYG